MGKDLLAQPAEPKRGRGPLRLRVLDGTQQRHGTPVVRVAHGPIGSSTPVVFRTRVKAFESKP